MGKRGPLPSNLEERWLRCGVGQRPKRGEKPVTMPRMPAGLSEGEQSVWRKLVPRIAALRILDEADQLALADLCRCVVRLEEAERDISERGLLIEGERGPVKNPACQLARTYRDSLLKWAQRFGLTPGDRGRIDLPEPEKGPDDLERFLSTPRQNDTEDPRLYLQREA